MLLCVSLACILFESNRLLADPMACTARSMPVVLAANDAYGQVGDVLITCTGGTPTAEGKEVPYVDLVIRLNTTLPIAFDVSEGFYSLHLTIDEAPLAVWLYSTSGGCI